MGAAGGYAGAPLLALLCACALRCADAKTWSAAPTGLAFPNATGVWEDVAGLAVTVRGGAGARLLLSHTLSVYAAYDSPDASYVAEGSLQRARVKAEAALGRAVVTLNDDRAKVVKVQWKAAGAATWRSDPSLKEGFSSGRVLTATAHEALHAAEPLSAAALSRRDWVAVKDTAATFDLPYATDVQLGYAVTLMATATQPVYAAYDSPDASYVAEGSLQPTLANPFDNDDLVQARLTVDGQSYRETVAAASSRDRYASAAATLAREERGADAISILQMVSTTALPEATTEDWATVETASFDVPAEGVVVVDHTATLQWRANRPEAWQLVSGRYGGLEESLVTILLDFDQVPPLVGPAALTAREDAATRVAGLAIEGVTFLDAYGVLIELFADHGAAVFAATGEQRDGLRPSRARPYYELALGGLVVDGSDAGELVTVALRTDAADALLSSATVSNVRAGAALGPATGGTRVLLDVAGAGAAPLSCQFGNATAPAELLYNDTYARARAEASRARATPALRVTDGGFWSDERQFLYEAPLVEPGCVPSDALACVVGGTPTPATYVNATALSCVAPPSDVEGAAGVAVSTNGVDVSATTRSFEYTRPLADLVLRPAFGPVAGGTRVEVSSPGGGFDVGLPYLCRFGLDAAPAAVYDAATLVCYAPPRSAETNDTVTVSGDGGNSSGPPAGGTVVVVSGAGFLALSRYGAVRCAFGDALADAVVVNDVVLKCARPAPRARAVGLKLSVGGRDPASSGRALTYVYEDDALLSALEPASGPAAGGTVVAVSA
ncbi:hypothetical protein SO694_00002344 [Aureococcus anophagefferens]|uniref:IPT/TIG domain-containing protein n=1 Tax=Aureococcus anophagefferens TaxID=44056 RepID=A0ABR1GD87_AURAN